MDNNLPHQSPKITSIDGFIKPQKANMPLRKTNHNPKDLSGLVSQTKAGVDQPNDDDDDNILPINAAITSNNMDNSMLNRTIIGNLSKQSHQRALRDKNKQPTKKRNKKKIVLLSFMILIIGIVLAGAWDAWQLYHKLHRLSVGNLTASVGGAENILVAGSTNRCNLKVQNAQWGFCSDGVTGVNSDIIFIVHVVPSTHSVSILSIPRDTFIPNARSGDEAFKIDAALYQGPSQLVAAVEQDFGIPIQHYVEVGFDGFVNIVNAIGGIKMNFPEAVYDSESYLNVPQPGCYLLNGVQALQVVRARHLQYKAPGISTNDHYDWPQEAESDIARIARTHEFLRVLASSITAKGISNPITDQKLVDALAPQVQVDSGFSISTMIELMQDFHDVNINNVPQYTLPIVTTGFGSYDYNGNNMGDVVFPYEGADEQIIDQFLGQSASTNTMTGSPLPPPASVRVNVINGSGISNQAEQVSSGLQSLGFNIVGQPTTATPVSYQAQETVVYYANRSMVGYALAVAHDLSGYVIISQNATMVSADSSVSVVTGTGLSVNVASSSSSSGSSTQNASSSSSSTTTSTSLGPLSSANEPLAAWDPRACTANQPVMTNSNI